MSSKVHNKKRNAILVYEFLIRTISRSLVENDKRKSAAALKILRRHFKPGTELYREFRLMNALLKTTVSSDHVAASILREAKEAVARIDMSTLDRQKSLLIKSINHALNEGDFYDQQIDDYRTCATIQTLFNEWRSEEKDLNTLAKYEDQLLHWLVTEKTHRDDEVISEDTSGTSRVLMKVMSKKLNEKYSGVLNEQQKSLIKAYALSAASDDKRTLYAKIQEIKSDVVNVIDGHIAKLNNNDYLKNKLTETKSMILAETVETIDDETITRFMLYSRLKNEIETEE